MNVRGYLLLFAAGLCIGTLSIAAKFGLQQSLPPITLLASRTVLASGVIGVGGVILWFGLISTSLARLFLFAGIHAVGSKQAALFSPLDTVVSICLAIVFLGETIVSVQWIGIMLIIVSVVLAPVWCVLAPREVQDDFTY